MNIGVVTQERVEAERRKARVRNFARVAVLVCAVTGFLVWSAALVGGVFWLTLFLWPVG